MTLFGPGSTTGSQLQSPLLELRPMSASCLPCPARLPCIPAAVLLTPPWEAATHHDDTCCLLSSLRCCSSLFSCILQLRARASPGQGNFHLAQPANLHVSLGSPRESFMPLSGSQPFYETCSKSLQEKQLAWRNYHHPQSWGADACCLLSCSPAVNSREQLLGGAP